MVSIKRTCHKLDFGIQNHIGINIEAHENFIIARNKKMNDVKEKFYNSIKESESVLEEKMESFRKLSGEINEYRKTGYRINMRSDIRHLAAGYDVIDTIMILGFENFTSFAKIFATCIYLQVCCVRSVGSESDGATYALAAIVLCEKFLEDEDGVYVFYDVATIWELPLDIFLLIELYILKCIDWSILSIMNVAMMLYINNMTRITCPLIDSLSRTSPIHATSTDKLLDVYSESEDLNIMFSHL